MLRDFVPWKSALNTPGGSESLISLSSAPRHWPHCTLAGSLSTDAHGQASHGLPPTQFHIDHTTLGVSCQYLSVIPQILLYAGISVLSPRGNGNTTVRDFDFAILAFWFLLLVALAGPPREKTYSYLLNQRRNGKAFSSLTARGGGLPVEVIKLSAARKLTDAKIRTS